MVNSASYFRMFNVWTLYFFVGIIGAITLTGCNGCSDGAGAETPYERQKRELESAADTLKANNAKLVKKQYPGYGEALSVDLSGAKITDKTFDELAKVGLIAELVLAQSTVTDAHAVRINAKEIGAVLVKLDLSKTEFSDIGLAELRSLNLLRELNVAGSKVTSDGIAKFQQERLANKSVPEMFRTVRVTK